MMKRSRHKPRPKFIESTEPVGLSAEFQDFGCDLPDDLRRELPNDWQRAQLQQSKEKGD